MVGFSDVVEGGGERGVGGEVEEGGVVERDNWFFPFHFDGVLFIGWERGGFGEGDREFGWDFCFGVDIFGKGNGVEGGEGGRACREFWGGRARRSNGKEGGNVGEEGVAD